jgi:hypothetical protein
MLSTPCINVTPNIRILLLGLHKKVVKVRQNWHCYLDYLENK